MACGDDLVAERAGDKMAGVMVHLFEAISNFKWGRSIIGLRGKAGVILNFKFQFGVKLTVSAVIFRVASSDHEVSEVEWGVVELKELRVYMH